MSRKTDSIVYGILGSFVLLFVYIELLTLANSFQHAIDQFVGMWYLLTPLIAGFGIQIGLYSYIRSGLKIVAASETGAVAASGGVSGTSMVLCCLHHLTDVLPIIGLSVAALFFAQYQAVFLLLGILSNIVGIIMMLGVMQKHNLFSNTGFFSSIFRYNMRGVRNNTIILSVILMVLAVFLTTPFSQEQITGVVSAEGDISNNANVLSLPRIANEGNGLTIDITPINFASGERVVFDVEFNTHQGSLDFDPVDVSVLTDNTGKVYYPAEWTGPGAGGHHRSGKLEFPPLEGNPTAMTLTIKDVYSVPERVFTWDIGG